MIGALWTGISGLAAHQSALDNESNNIANVNTVGYKASRISFADQIYQNKIGKGSFVQDAEKIFVTGGSKITGVEYDVALQGDGFFTVINKNTLGTAETFYTRAGNFRMGESGTLQTADGYEVQGWAMSSIDQKNDVVSTNPNATRFSDDYIKNLGSSIIRHGDFVETIAAKATNFDETAKSDSTTVFSGAGAKTKSAKLKDIDLALADYNDLLQKYKNDPTLPSQGSTSQISQVNFRTGVPPTSIIGKEGDSIAIVLNGNTYTQNFIPTKTTPDYRTNLWNSLPTTPINERTLYSLTDPSVIEGMPITTEAERTAKDTEIAKYDKLAGKIETYKAMADQISNKEAGLVAYMAKDRLNPTSDALDPNGLYEASTNLADMLRGVIQVKSLIPGKEFKITQVAEYSGENTNYSVKGTFQTTSTATVGSGKAGIDASREALSRLVSGNQQSVYTTQDLYGGGVQPRTFTFSIELYDKDTGMVIPVPNDGNVPPKADAISIATTGASIDEVVNAINNTRTASGPQLGDYIVAKNINGSLVLESNDSNYDVEFDSKLEQNAIAPVVGTKTATDDGGAALVASTDSYPFNGGGSSPAQLTLNIGATTLTITTEKGETASGAAIKLQEALITEGTLTTDYEVVAIGSNIVVRELAGNYTGAAIPSTLTVTQTPAQASVVEFIEVNPNYSGRKGAGAEFMEIVTRVDQTSTQNSLQLRLDALNISDSKFGQFSIDDTGLVTIKEGGVEYAVGQVSIARFTNNRGLEAVGNNNFQRTQESGNAIYSTNNNNTSGVKGKALELSKADLSESLVNLMVFQRAFEANAKSITTSDELLSTLINLKR